LDPRFNSYRRTIDQLLTEISRRDEVIAELKSRGIQAAALDTSSIYRTPGPRLTADSKARAAIVHCVFGDETDRRPSDIQDLLAENWIPDRICVRWQSTGTRHPETKQPGFIEFCCRDFEEFYPVALGYAIGERYDLVIIANPRLPALLLGALIHKANACPIVLDIDRLEAVPDATVTLAELEAAGPGSMNDPNGDLAKRACESLITQFPARTVSSLALRRRFGGLVVCSVENTSSPDGSVRTAAVDHVGLREQGSSFEFDAAIKSDPLALAINRARQDCSLPKGVARLLLHADSTYGTLRRAHRSGDAEGTVTVAEPRVQDDQPDLVVFWKQNDSGLYGRRSDMLIRYLQKSGKIGRVLQFDMSQPAEVLSRLSRCASDDLADHMILRNLIDDQYGLRDNESIAHRSFLWSREDRARRLLPELATAPSEFAAFVKSQMDTLGFTPSTSIAWVCPVVLDFPPVAAAIPFRAVVADLIDDQRVSDSTPDARERTVASYEETVPLCDVVLTNCKAMAEAFAHLRPQIHVIPNGAELPRYPADVPNLPELARFRGPLIGYVGHLYDRIDWPLLVAVAQRIPDASFVIVGSGARKGDIALCAGAENIHLLGPVDYKNLQSCIRSFDVAIMPHLVTDQTRRMNPLKIYNYVAVHRPVVSTSVDNIDPELAPFIRFADTPDKFVQAIRASLSDPLTERPGYIQAVNGISWEKRVAKTLEVLEPFLGA
jgi:glycosyltransferase involved in cell wall biosynthesis